METHRPHAGSVCRVAVLVGFLNILAQPLRRGNGSGPGARSRGPQVNPRPGRVKPLDSSFSKKQVPPGLRWRDPAIARCDQIRRNQLLHSFLVAHHWRESWAWPHAKRRARRHPSQGRQRQGPTPRAPRMAAGGGKDPKRPAMARQTASAPLMEEELTLQSISSLHGPKPLTESKPTAVPVMVGKPQLRPGRSRIGSGCIPAPYSSKDRTTPKP